MRHGGLKALRHKESKR